MHDSECDLNPNPRSNYNLENMQKYTAVAATWSISIRSRFSMSRILGNMKTMLYIYHSKNVKHLYFGELAMNMIGLLPSGGQLLVILLVWITEKQLKLYVNVWHFSNGNFSKCDWFVLVGTIVYYVEHNCILCHHFVYYNYFRERDISRIS